jgi:hypothetical protein
MERRKDAIVAALWANSNWDDDKGSRRGAIAEIEGNYQDAVRIAMGHTQTPTEEELDEDNPFLRPAIQAARQLDVPLNPDATVAQNIDDTDLLKLDQ